MNALENRIPKEQIVLGKAYILFGRNGGVGIASEYAGELVYIIRRYKWGREFIDQEWDYQNSNDDGTAIPIRELPDTPPNLSDEKELLVWLRALEVQHEAEIFSLY